MKQLSRILVIVALVVTLVPAVPAEADSWPPTTPHFALPVTRLGGADRYVTSVAIARAAFPGWAGVHHVIVASGDTAALADPLSSGSLCWAYDAPLLLVSSRSVPKPVATAIAQIASLDPTVTITIVGGTHTVPAARLARLRALAPSARIERPWPRGDRYALAASIAARVKRVAGETSRTIPGAVFIANGADPGTFSDALSASAVSANSGIPVLLTRKSVLPYSTRLALGHFASAERIVVGGAASVSTRVAALAHFTARWGSSQRYATSAIVARNAANRGWGGSSAAVLFAAVPDALCGASLAGRTHSAALFASSPRLLAPTGGFLASPPATLTAAYLLGGSGTLSGSVAREVSGAPGIPLIFGPRPYEGKTGHAYGAAGSNTTTVTLTLNGIAVARRAVKPYGAFDFGKIAIPSKGVMVRVVASNPATATTTAARRVKRVTYPYPTVILIVKHEFKLYWVKNNELVHVYPIAIGRASMETPAPSTWKVLAKYITDPSGVYGPRKMRLFRLRNGRYVYTAYGIHGTNQPWVIGTKASHGCIRLYNSDILKLWPQVPLGTMVVIKP